MQKLKFTLQIKYNNDILLYSDKWYIKATNADYVEPLIRFNVRSSVAYRTKGGKKFYYKRKMDRIGAVKVDLSYQLGLPCPF
jgi:hypothetical protein